MAKEPREMPFRINMNRPPISKNQTSLIDVIEELTAEERENFTDEVEDESTDAAEAEEVLEESVEAESEKEVEETAEAEEDPVTESEKPEEVVEEVAEDEQEDESSEVEQELPEVKIEPESEIEPAPIEDQIEEAPVRDVSEQPETLADRLKMTPLADLKKAIGLNQKFQFINELFEGDADEYADSIEKLNSADNMESAINYFEKELAAKNDWEEDHPSVLDLRELVQRRYL